MSDQETWRGERGPAHHPDLLPAAQGDPRRARRGRAPRRAVKILSGIALLLGVLTVAGCVSPTPPPPASVRIVAVMPVANHTGDVLLIRGGSLLEKYVFRADRVTVADALGAELRALLGARGFTVVNPARVEGASQGRAPGSASAAAELARQAGLEGAALWVDIRRWEADAASYPDNVIVAVEAGLVDPSTGAVLWQAHRAPYLVETQNSVTLGTAYGIAVETVAAELVAGWGVASPAAASHATEP